MVVQNAAPGFTWETRSVTAHQRSTTSSTEDTTREEDRINITGSSIRPRPGCVRLADRSSVGLMGLVVLVALVWASQA